MEVKKFNPFVVVKPNPKPKSIPKAKIKPKHKTKLEAEGLSLENKKKLDIIYAKGFVKTSRSSNRVSDRPRGGGGLGTLCIKIGYSGFFQEMGSPPPF